MNQDEFVSMMADVLEVDPSEITTEASLFDFPTYDSVCALTLMVRLEDDAKVTCSPNELAALKTIADVQALLVRHGQLEA
jgi:acyl carrier protein